MSKFSFKMLVDYFFEIMYISQIVYCIDLKSYKEIPDT